METTDVLIVGGGPAGSTLAWRLRDAGLHVSIMDKREFPRDKVCAGWITPAVVEELALDTADYRKERTFQPIHGFRISHLGGKEVESRYDGEPVSFGIRRCEFDEYLLRRAAAEARTALRLGEAFKGMRREDGAWVVNDDLRARLVIGAGGHFCPVARALGAKLGSSESVVAAQEIEFEMSPAQRAACPVDGEVPELYFCRDLKGYGWVFRKGDWLNVGLGREDNHKLSEHVAEFRQFLIDQGRIPSDTPVKFHGHAYLLYLHAPRPVVADGAMLIGDAAGLAYPQSGEGIRPAIESALMAAEVIRAADGDYAQARLAPYQARLTERFGDRPSDVGIASLLPDGLKQFIASRLLATRWFTRGVVMDRWFLHTHQPVLRVGTA
ncbi:MAG TPA: NAD(P)/FAD-dependent oxidoreductase [Gammaproteobacteria bacterium]|nr:NAD(P)/FAD-dependent oxidoreductase [Gammaproteobacteria bacterium]